MRYTLLSRFQGILCGSLIGEKLGDSNTSSVYPKIRLTILQNLLRSDDIKGCILPEEANPSVSAQVILLALPIIMFFHESPSLLTEKLRQTGEIWQLEELVLQDLLLWGRCIALALREKLKPDNFLNQFLNLGLKTPLIDNLYLIQEYLKTSKSLQQLVAELSAKREDKNTIILLALYCFASTPEDFSLSIRRATHCQTPQVTAGLTGALAGAYNGIKGIPLTWRLAAQKNPLFQDSQQGAKQMFNRWLGLYEPSKIDVSPSIACHDAGIIQARASLKIISQLSIENEKI